MKKSRFTEEKIIEVLKQLEAGRKVSELSREYGVSTASIYAWKSKYARPGSEPAKAAQRTRRREPQAEDIGRRKLRSISRATAFAFCLQTFENGCSPLLRASSTPAQLACPPSDRDRNMDILMGIYT